METEKGTDLFFMRCMLFLGSPLSSSVNAYTNSDCDFLDESCAPGELSTLHRLSDERPFRLWYGVLELTGGLKRSASSW